MDLEYQQIFGIISLICSLLVLISLIVCKKWRKRMPPVKWLLFVMSFFNAIRALNYVFTVDESSDGLCRLQASVMQSKETIYRHIAYHVVVNGYGLAVVIWMNIVGSYGHSSTPWCYVKEPRYRIFFAYVPIWVAIFGIIVLDASVIQKTLRISNGGRTRNDSTKSADSTSSVDSNLSKPDNGSTTSSIFKGMNSENAMNKRMIRLLVRMIVYPVALMLLLVPGFILRMCDWSSSCKLSSAYGALSTAQRICDPSAGIVIAVIWVLSDLNVRNEWAKILRPYFRVCIGKKHHSREKRKAAQNNDQQPQVSGTLSESTAEMSRIGLHNTSSGISSSVVSSMHYVTDNSSNNIDSSVFSEDEAILSIPAGWRADPSALSGRRYTGSIISHSEV